ncbi:MAG: PH domain-containing protein [Candidatus Thiodiazotropha endolucinida]
MITNINGTPFNESMASYMANVLTRETGRPYRTSPFMEGYGVESVAVAHEQAEASQDFQEIYLRPAIQSQLWNLVLLVVAMIVYFNIETTMVMVGLDKLQAIVYQLLGKTFPWEVTVYYLGKASLVLALLIAWVIFYNLASRKYMIGPKGVEATIGLFNKDEIRVEYLHFRGVRVRRSIWKRIFFYGDILIATSGTAEGGDVTFNNIALPLKYKAILKERMKRLA